MSRPPSPRRRSSLVLERLDDRLLLDAGLQRGVWTITGTPGRAPVSDTIVIDADPSDPSKLRATVNGNLISTEPASRVRSIKVDGRSGDDDIRIDESSGPITVPTVLLGGTGADRIDGGSGPDLIRGGRGDDLLSGRAGKDKIFGEGNNDLLDGGAGDDLLDGGPGRNTLIAGGGHDRLIRGTASADPMTFSSDDELRRFFMTAASRAGAPGEGTGRLGAAPAANLTAGGDAKLASASFSGSAAATSHSNTNVQVEGVDEADIVKTDGNFLYVLSRQELIIVDALPANGVSIASRTVLEGNPVAEYLDGDRLTVVTSIYGGGAPMSLLAADNAEGAATSKLMVAPGGFTYTPPRVKVIQFDVSDRTNPKVIEHTSLDGSYIDSRSTDGKVYVAVQNDPTSRLQPRFLESAGKDGRYETQAEFLDRVRSAPLEEIAPRFVTHREEPSGEIVRDGLLTDPRNTLRPQATDDQNLLSVVVFDSKADADGPTDMASVVGSYATTMYASKDNLYLLTPRYPLDGNGDGSTSILKFSLGSRIQLAASGEVRGQVLDQFSVDEFQGNLRIATTVDHWDPSGQNQSTNNVYVLAQAGDRLDVVGRIEDIAPGERIMSARFDGATGYLVTFEQVDPLFTLDLSDPRAPKVAGSLTMPGFSRFLQPVGKGLLLGVGRDADPNTGQTKDLQLSLFDVSDPAHPRRIANTALAPADQSWSWSDAEYDHHAVSYFPERGVLAIPVSGSYTVPATDRSEFPEYRTRSALYVYHLDATNGFRLIGKVDHDSSVLRSVRIDDSLYSLADLDLKVNRLDESLTALGSVVLQTDDSGYHGGGVGIAVPLAAAVR